MAQRDSDAYSYFDDEEIDNLVIISPDGGWGWVVVFSAFLVNFVVDGIVYTFGLLISELAEDLKCSVGTITILGSILSGCSYIVGPLASAMLNRYDFRFVAITGCLLAIFGYVIASFCIEYWQLILTNGVLVGSGLGILYLPSLICPGLYFAKFRALATGITTCGSGVGAVVVPQILKYSLASLGWRNTYRLYICFIGIAILASLTFRPLAPKKLVHKKVTTDFYTTPSRMIPKQRCAVSLWCKENQNKNYPTANEFIAPKDAIYADEEEINVHIYGSTTSLMPVATTSPRKKEAFLARMSRKNVRANKCELCMFQCINLLCCMRMQTSTRPMYRDDIFFTHSIKLLPKYQKNKWKKSQIEDMQNYHMSVTRVTPRHETFDIFRPICGCPQSVARALSTMLDCNLMKSIAFQMFAISGTMTMFGYMIPFLYVKDRAVTRGIDNNSAFWLLSTIGAFNTLGRLLSGVIPIILHIDIIIYSSFFIGLAGGLTAFSGWYMNTWVQFVYCGLYGFCGSVIAALRPIICVELFGLQNLTNAFGLQLLYVSVSAFSGPTVAGILYDYSQNYDYSFYLSGSCLGCGAFILLICKFVRKWEIRTNFVEL